jgi:hypothetical protein
MVVLVNRAKMGTATTGTGTITLGSAESGYQTFADAGVTDGQVVRYVIEDGSDWEIGSGAYTASGTTLSRTVSESSNADAALNLTGSAVVYVSAAAEDIPSLELYAENPSSPTAPSATGANAVAIGSGSVASNANTVALSDATASGSSAIALGNSTLASGFGSVALGFSSNAQASYAIGIGRTSNASGLYSSAIGLNSGANGAIASTGSGAMALGGSYASGTDSFAAAIANNTSSYGATGANSVAIGSLVKSTGIASVAFGYSNLSSNQYATVGGGGNNSATVQYATVVGGRGAISDKFGKFAFGSSALGFSSTQGSAQGGYLVLLKQTTDGTPSVLTSNNSTASAFNQIILPNNSAFAFHGTIVAREQASAGTDCAAWKIEGLIRREGSAGTTVLVNSATTVLDNTPGWGMALSADTTNGGLKIEVTGAAATNIRWVATVHTSEVTY